MKLLLFLVIAFFQLNQMVHSQEFFPGIKQMVTIHKKFEINENGDSIVSIDKGIQYFNTAGAEEKSVNYTDDAFYYSGVSEYYADGRLKRYTRFGENKKVLSDAEFKYHFDSIRQFSETNMYSSNELESIQLDSLDAKGNILVSYTTLLPDLHSTEINEYDINGRRIKMTMLYDNVFQYTIHMRYSENNLLSEQYIESGEDWFRGVYKFEYLDFDAKGNWLSCKQYKDGILVSETVRIITY